MKGLNANKGSSCILRRILEVGTSIQNRRYGSALHSLNMLMISCVNDSFVLATVIITNYVSRII